MDIEKTLLDLKKKIENAKAERDRAEGALEESWKRVKAEFGATTLEEIEHLLDDLDAQIDKLEKEIAQDLAELKKGFAA